MANLTGVLNDLRRARSWLSWVAAIGLVPWIIYLAHSLPLHYYTSHWRQLWVGFDAFEVMFLLATAVLGVLGSHLVTVFSFGTGVLFICDAWIDVMTATGTDLWWSVALAVFAEIPSAFIFIVGSMRIVKLSLLHALSVDPATVDIDPRISVWKIPLGGVGITGSRSSRVS
jgi:hypothetical protein